MYRYNGKNNPCPFCGLGPLECVLFYGNNPITFGQKPNGKQIRCINCGAAGPVYGDKKSALIGWNRGDHAADKSGRDIARSRLAESMGFPEIEDEADVAR